MTTELDAAIDCAVHALDSWGLNEVAHMLRQAATKAVMTHSVSPLLAAGYGTRPVTTLTQLPMNYEDALMAGDARQLYTARQIADLEAHNTLAAVALFMNTAGQEVKPRPGQPTPEVLRLRLALELEELYEKAQAFGLEGTFQKIMRHKIHDNMPAYPKIGSPNFPFCEDTGIYDAVEVLDAAVDQRYVQDGTVLACGLQEAFPEAFADVQKSNMSKFPTTYEAAALTIEKYTQEGIASEFIAPSPWKGCYVVRRTGDGKILKSVDYVPANLGPILAKYTVETDA